MNQSRLMSLIEVSANTAIGYAVSFAAWPVVAALSDDVTYSVGGHVWIVAAFTALSIARGYVVRRLFETRIHRLAARVARWWADDDDDWRWR